jgi:SAM-dependent methyltransferase
MDERAEADPLSVATQGYFFKPVAAFFSAFSLRAYHAAGMRMNSTVLDLGCGDAMFGSLMQSALGTPRCLLGCDRDRAALRSAQTRTGYSAVVPADAKRLPFADDSIDTIWAHGVLAAIEPGLPTALKEIRRVLSRDGKLFCTVRTPRFREWYFWTRFLRALGLHRMAELYADRMDRRCTASHTGLSTQDWLGLMDAASLRVEKVVGFFPNRLVTLWSVLSWQILRVNGLLKLIPWPPLHRAAARAQRALFGRVYRATPIDTDPESCGFILISATPRAS